MDVVPTMQGHVLERVQLEARYSRKDPGVNAKRVGDNAPALIDGSALPSLPTALNNAMSLIGEMTNDDISTPVLAEISLEFAAIEDIVGEVRFNRQQEGWAVGNPRSLQLVDAHIGILDLLILEFRSRPSTLQRLEVARAALISHRQQIKRR